MSYYKAVRLDKTSHHDQKTKWAAGRIIRPDRIDETNEPCGHGIHCSPTLLHAVGYQKGPSLYCEVEPRGILGQDDTKLRCREVKVLRWLGQEEVDQLAGFRLWEVNHPVNPLLLKASGDQPALLDLLKEWASVGASVGDSVWSYIGGLFPGIKAWKYAGKLGPNPWKPLLALWYAGYVPSFDGKTWRLHAGPKAEIVLEWPPARGKEKA